MKEKSENRGERTGQEKLEALTVFSQRIQARDKKETEREREEADHKGEPNNKEREERPKEREGW